MAFKKLTYLAGGADGKIAVKTSLRAIGGVEVLIKVTHSGLCGTDVHDRTAGCGLGHEGVGIIENVGNEVTSAKLGHRVGWGWQFASCGLCRECLSGYRQYCPESCGQKYGELEQGAFGDYVVKHQDFVYPIPDEIESKYAGPLNCAGITVYEALHAADTKPSDRVGIVGFGGLGHIAVMYAHAMGCAVTVFSSSDDKRADAMVLGATEFCLLSGSESSPKLTSDINVLLLCGNGLPNFDIYMPFLLPGHRLIASTEASRKNHVDALAFAARHGIKPWIKEFPMSAEGLTRALEALENGEIRYRAVLSTELEGKLL